MTVKPDLDMPVITRAGELTSMTQLRTIYVHDTQHRGRAYLGVALAARWDEEHGAGVMLHRKRIVSVGGHDEALLQWIAEKDASRRRRKR